MKRGWVFSICLLSLCVFCAAPGFGEDDWDFQTRHEVGGGAGFLKVPGQTEWGVGPGYGLGVALYLNRFWGMGFWGDLGLLNSSGEYAAFMGSLTAGPAFTLRTGRWVFPFLAGFSYSGGVTVVKGTASPYNLGIGAGAGGDFRLTEQLYVYGRLRSAFGFANGNDVNLTVTLGIGAALNHTWPRWQRNPAPEQPPAPDLAGPDLRFAANPDPFSPDGDGIDDTVTFTLEALDPSPIAFWSLDILDPREPSSVFSRFEGVGPPPQTLVWDGRNGAGEPAMSAFDYPVRFSAQDVHGNASALDGAVDASLRVHVDVLAARNGDVLRLNALVFSFSGNQTDFSGLDSAALAKNNEVLARVAELLNTRYRDYRVTVEGHANPVLGTWQEEQGTLLPLSAARARFVMERLAALGVAPDRLSFAGLGGSRPLVDPKDTATAWKNRRVEFVLTR